MPLHSSISLSDQAQITLIARMCLGLFFLPSAFGKLANQRAFIRGTVDYDILPPNVARIVGRLLPWIELAIGLALVLGILLPISGILAAGLLVVFAVAVGINLHRGRAISCNCYGIASTATIGWGTVVRNAVLSAAAVGVASLAWLSQSSPWTSVWSSDWAFIRTPLDALMVALLVSWGVLLVGLIEWAIDVYAKVSTLRSQRHGEPVRVEPRWS